MSRLKSYITLFMHSQSNETSATSFITIHIAKYNITLAREHKHRSDKARSV